MHGETVKKSVIFKHCKRKAALICVCIFKSYLGDFNVALHIGENCCCQPYSPIIQKYVGDFKTLKRYSRNFVGLICNNEIINLRCGRCQSNIQLSRYDVAGVHLIYGIDIRSPNIGHRATN
jgi:hypothetical protein